MNIHQITFSPTGGTRTVCEFLCEGLGGEIIVTDLCLKEEQILLPHILYDDIAVIAMPVYAGRVPALAVERLRRIRGNSARCVVVAVYGNRAYDDALLEMQDVAADMGFRVLAAVGAIAEHSIARVYGAGRPDGTDHKELTDFGVVIRRKAESADTFALLTLPGNRPYRPCNVGPFPEADWSCTGCGTCVDQCPVGAIPSDLPQSVNKNICISCMRCVTVCPMKVRGIGTLEGMITEKLKPLCTTRKSNELFI